MNKRKKKSSPTPRKPMIDPRALRLKTLVICIKQVMYDMRRDYLDREFEAKLTQKA